MDTIPNVYIAATVTSCLALLIIGGLLFLRSPKENRPVIFLLIFIMLPMNAIAFHFVRLPLDSWLAAMMGKGNEFYHFIRTLYAPLTEEPAKLWPLLIPWFYRRLATIKIHHAAVAIGLGFGIGEAWTIAGLLSSSPQIAKLQWYMLSGYMTERIMVCVMHAAFTATALYFILAKKRIAIGVLVAMMLHFLGNLPIFLAAKNFLGLGNDAWAVILQLWILLYFIAMAAILARMAYGRQWLRKTFRGRVCCPSCQMPYEHPIFGINLFHKRYERCPHCRRWHLVSAFDEEKTDKLDSGKTSDKTL